MRFLLPFLLLVTPLSAQTIRVSMGDNQLFNSAGVTATAYFAQQTDFLSVGEVANRFVIGAASEFPFQDGRLTVGDRIFQASGVNIDLRGVSYERYAHKKKYHWSLFSGAVGQAWSATYLQTTNAYNFGAGGSLDVRVSSTLRNSTTFAVAGNQKSAVDSVLWTPKNNRTSANAQIGVLQNHPFMNVNVNFLPARWASIGAGHSTYFYNGTKSVSDSLSASLHSEHWNVHTTAYTGHSGSYATSGQDVGVGFNSQRLIVSADTFSTPADRQELIGVTERMTPRFSVSQYVSLQGNNRTVNWGGAYTGNKFSASVQYQTIFLPIAGRNPFKQVMVLNVALQLERLTAHYETFVAPDGKILSGIDGTTFLSGPIVEQSAMYRKTVSGKYVITGVCVDEQNAPVEGCAMEINGVMVYSDDMGVFETNVRKTKPYPMIVQPDEFPAAGRWIVLDAPQVIEPGQPVIIRVTRF